MEDSVELAAAALDAVSAHVAVVDRNGTVVLCNEAWNRFARANGAADVDWIGWNYLGVCSIAEESGEANAGVIGRALEALLGGASERRLDGWRNGGAGNGSTTDDATRRRTGNRSSGTVGCTPVRSSPCTAAFTRP